MSFTLHNFNRANLKTKLCNCVCGGVGGEGVGGNWDQFNKVVSSL